MRLDPPVSEEEALQWLIDQATVRWVENSDSLRDALVTLARAMAAVSAVGIPEEIEPNLF